MTSNLPSTFGDLGELFDGPHATPKRMDAGPYFLSISSLSSGRLDLTQSDHVSEEDFRHWTRRVTPQEGDLLFSYETRLGEAALMPAGVAACLGRRMALLRPNRQIVDPRFLLYYYLSPLFQQLIEQHTVHGATVNRISLSTMGSWPITIPSVAEQRAIAEVLGSLDDKIAANTKLAETIEQLGCTKLGKLGINEEPREEAVELGAYFDFNPRRTAVSDEAVLIDMQALPTSQPLVSQWGRGPKRGGARFMNGDTLLARITPCLENRKTGFVDFLNDGEVGIGSTEFIVVRSRETIPLGASYFVATSNRFRDFAIQNMVGTSGRQRVSAADIARFELNPIATADLVEFGQWADANLKVLGALRDENRNLAATRDTLLPQLMSGKLRVRDIENTMGEMV